MRTFATVSVVLCLLGLSSPAAAQCLHLDRKAGVDFADSHFLVQLSEPLDRHITKLLDGEYHALGYSRLFKTLLVIVVIDFILCSALFTFIDRQEHNIYGREEWVA